MALDSGDSWGGSGALPSGSMAEAIYNAMTTFMGAPESGLEDKRREICVATAKGIVDHIVANADVTVEITTSDSGLQRDPASSDDTLAPSSTKEISGSVS